MKTKWSGWAACIALLGCTGSFEESLGEAQQSAINGKEVFEKEAFGGNGRTCATCHLSSTGTVSPEDAQALFASDPQGPLFRSIDSDDGSGLAYARLLADATFRIPVGLAANVTVDGNPATRTVVLARGVPTTNNVGLEDHLMVDGREGADLSHQAVSAVHTHYENTVEPTGAEADAIAEHQREKLFSSNAIKHFFKHGTPPSLPLGGTASEQRGRVLFDGSTAAGKCAQCHAGPMLNETSAFNGCSVGGPPCLPFPAGAQLQPPGDRLSTNFTSELNFAGLPVRTYVFTGVPGFGTVTMTTPDPGRGIVTGDPCVDFPLACIVAGPGQANTVFKIPTLWGINETAPYFHDNSAKTLEDVMVQYQLFFHITAVGLNDPGLELSNQDVADAIAFMKLL